MSGTAKLTSDKILAKAIRELNKKLPFKSHRQTQELLEFAADNLVDAYRIGAEEARIECINRLIALAAKEHQEQIKEELKKP